jgi:hypothetical protein
MIFKHKQQNSFLRGRSYNKTVVILLAITLFNLLSCKKFVEVNTITGKLLSDQIFDNDATANSAIAGIYRQSRDNLNVYLGLYNSMQSDEVAEYNGTVTYDNYKNNMVVSTETTLPWTGLYTIVYSCNAAIEGIGQSTGMSAAAKQYYTGEAKFNRAFAYFYLVNLFGDVPLITSTDVQASSTASRTASAAVYAQIISDLKDAENLLGTDYTYTGGERTRANKWVAAALLARVYLYQQDWPDAEAQATAVINSGLYNLLSTPTGIFTKNNNEVILQWANSSTDANQIATFYIFTTSPGAICTSFLLNAFESGDLRKSIWLKAGTYSSQTLYYPFKYTTTAIAPNEYYTVIRLAELYLIRAEARAEQNNVSNAVSDLNVIRSRAGLPGLSSSISQSACLSATMQERRVELFTECCHRWFDLKRTGAIDAVMNAEKPSTWKSTAALLPIPLTNIQRDPNLKQNPGYQ